MWNIFKKLRITNWRIDHSELEDRSFRNSFVLILGLIACPLLAHAQWRKAYVPATLGKDTTKFWIFQNVTMGPYFTGGISRQNEDMPDASSGQPWHSAPRFAYRIGGTIDFSISEWIGFDFTALYDTRELYLASPGDSDNIDIGLGYLAFQPSIRIYWLLLGLAFDLPMSGSATENVTAYQQHGQPTYNQNVNVPTSDLSPLTELRATLSVPVVKGDNAELYVVLSGSYPLTKTLNSSTPSFDTTGITRTSGGHFSGPFAPGQGPLPTVEAGISYQFDLLH
ncbi:MAG TPA: hypothetical protein VFH95_06640 [Candidatus Kapabacteria bacterium]|nr:hypothetical protein [Candidatus Kapabacteria bacterium]